ncbi:MAG: EAL domain-containing protein [Helicobacteraceae bacterium]|jgi:diguanylate cyclase (GGDEF)-like protein/PAS domain S-box-containing protein|nr:EAL domain-containing protein [Helicobacteraceae bacterium]
MSTEQERLNDTQIRAEMITIAYNNLGLSSLVVVVNSLVLTMALWGVVDHTTLLLWLSMTTVVSLARFYSVFYFKHYKLHHPTKYWEQLFLIGVTAAAVLWAAASLLLFTPESMSHQAILMIVIAGISAGAASSLATVKNAVRLFLVLMLVPLIIQLLLQNSEVHLWIALLIVLFLAFLSAIAKRYNENSYKMVESRLMYDKAKKELHITEERFETVFREAPVGIFLYDTRLNILEVNQEFYSFLEAPQHYLVGLDMNSLRDKRIMPALQAVLDKLDGFYEGQYKTQYKSKEIWITMRTSPVLDGDRRVIGGIGIVNDITERMNDQKKIQHQAFYDALTNIPNRTLLMERIHQEIIRFKRHKVIAGLLFLDLDHFKNINDSLGHQIGDQLLIETAKRLQSILRDEDTVSRLGGDEFVILLPDLGSEPLDAIGKADLVARKVHKALSSPFTLQGHNLTTSTSIGMVITDEDNTTTDDLLKHADMAMYQAKKEWRGSTSFYRPEMDRLIKRRLTIDHALRSAIGTKELQLYFQPITQFATGKIIGAEALLRLEHPELGQITPDEFIPIAEESGIIIDIGEWVLNQSCTQFAQWQKELAPFCPLQKIAVNVSSKQFREATFVNKVLAAISENGLKPGQLELELTESIIIDNLELVTEKMLLLRSYNINLSIDDFGTGYSSLSYLKKLPFTTLKIDKSFTQDIQTNMDDADLIRTIISIAHRFHLDVIAEGVETVEQYAFLDKNHCNCYQGYYCSQPLPYDEFIDMVRKNTETCSLKSPAP